MSKYASDMSTEDAVGRREHYSVTSSLHYPMSQLLQDLCGIFLVRCALAPDQQLKREDHDLKTIT
jgi:hypothetical protein